ncbi:histidine-type phosphatase [Mucilaginibacter sp. dw_454]|uniref:histidine-type phosphatase n=1 Tax=Mucilaginibacter sp. dw_454 TaxID=2720079 RepID=UPI001BD39599|nr:histidine-type phosphatase [Mucilaginibacter sp. dw_454]
MIKKLFYLLTLFASVLAGTVQAQEFLGTKSLYQAPAQTQTPVPAGYKAVFINHVGRHGARHLTKEVNTSYAYNLLIKADSAKALTPKGEALLKMVKALDVVERGKVKSISAEGIQELQDIGERMYMQNPTVFAGAPKLNITETKEIRTKQSADAFLTGLRKGFTAEPVIKEYIDDTDLRFYDFSPTYTQYEDDGPWVKYREAIAKQNHLTDVYNATTQRFFKPKFLKTLSAANREKLVSDVYGFYAITFSLKHEISKIGLKQADVAFNMLFIPSEMKALSKIEEADDFYAKGPGIDPNGIQVRIAAPLLVDFINTSDEFVKNGTYNANLRFAHAETVSPIATLMDIDIASRYAFITDVHGVWQAANVIPLSANIQWIFYKNNAGNYLVKVLLNEKEVHILSVKTTTYPYYNWGDLRKFYTAKLKSLNVGLTDDMSAYLKNVK